MKKRIGDICTYFGGFTPSASELYPDGKYPYFKVAEMNRETNLKIMSDTDSYVRESRRFFPKGSIVFPKNGAAIATNKKRILGQDSIVDLNTGGVIPQSGVVSSEYLYYVFQHLDFSKYTRRGAVPTLDTNALKLIEINVPSLDEQEQITAQLNLIYSIVENKRVQLSCLDTLAQTLFFELFGDPFVNEKGWDKLNFEKCIQKVKYTTKLQSKDYKNEGRFPIISQEEEYISGYWDNELDVFKVNKPVVIFGDHSRVLKYVPFDFVLGADGVRILSPNDFVEPWYLFYYIKACKIPSLGYSRHYKLLKELEVSVPPLELQRQFSKTISDIEVNKNQIKNSIREVETLFNSRMDFWFN